MCVLGKPVNSGDSVAGQAHGEAARPEAEALTDCSLLGELAGELAREKGSFRRKAIYFVLGKLGKHCPETDCASFLLSRLSVEPGAYMLAAVLQALRDISPIRGRDLSPVFLLLYDDRWLVRHSAIRALENTDPADSEGKLLDFMQQRPTDWIGNERCLDTLRVMGSSRAIPILEGFLRSPNRYWRDGARNAIQAIKDRAEHCQ
jgi:hypothetical protein